jgi:hypothetical protein
VLSLLGGKTTAWTKAQDAPKIRQTSSRWSKVIKAKECEIWLNVPVMNME